MDCLDAFVSLDRDTDHLSESPESSILEKILQLPEECQRKILERYFYDKHVVMFRYDGWGDTQPIPHTNQICVLSPFMTNGELIYLKHLVRQYREAHIIVHCEDIIRHFPPRNHTAQELTTIFNPACKTLFCELSPFSTVAEDETLLFIINLVVTYPMF